MIKGAERIVKVEDEIYQRYMVYWIAVATGTSDMNSLHVVVSTYYYICANLDSQPNAQLLKAFDARR